MFEQSGINNDEGKDVADMLDVTRMRMSQQRECRCLGWQEDLKKKLFKFYNW